MHFSGTTPNKIYEWIDKKNNGDNTDYIKGKQDTQEAINLFQSLYGMTFMLVDKLYEYLYNTLKLRNAITTESRYRAFITLNNDEIINLRLSKHFSTKHSLEKSKNRNGKPNVEYHLILDRTQSEPRENDIYNDGMYSGVEVMVKDINLSDFNDGSKRKGIIDEIIALLTNGTRPSSISENRQYRNMNLTESRLSNIIRESVNSILLREYHNQLRIPFSEFGNGHSFIDEFIDWIQYSSEKGVLPKPTITWEEGLGKGYDEYAKKGKNEWEDYDSLRDFIKTWEDNEFVEFDKNGNLYVERSITMYVPDDDIDS